jgi:hypothetical protein
MWKVLLDSAFLFLHAHLSLSLLTTGIRQYYAQSACSDAVAAQRPYGLAQLMMMNQTADTVNIPPRPRAMAGIHWLPSERDLRILRCVSRIQTPM